MKKLFFLAILGWMSVSLSMLSAVSIPPSPAPAATPQSSVITSQDSQFAAQLSPYHKQVFLTVFTSQMRQETINMMEESEKDRDDETPMSADMCVEQALMNHRNPQSKL